MSHKSRVTLITNVGDYGVARLGRNFYVLHGNLVEFGRAYPDIVSAREAAQELADAEEDSADDYRYVPDAETGEVAA